jgi:molybdopterin-binding protein
MKRSALFFGTMIVLLGVVLLGINLGVVDHRIWRYFWPLVLVLLGVWFLLGPYLSKGTLESVERSVPMMNDTEAEIHFNYGAGRMVIGSGAKPQELLSGSFTGGITEELHRNNGKAFLKINTPTDFIFPGVWPSGQHGLNWNVTLTNEIPLQLHIHSGACEARLDLTDLKVTDLNIETGASSTDVTLPQAAGFTRVVVKSGAAEVKLHVPQGVAAFIRESSGLSGINVDTNRFPQSGHTYQSADYSTAENKVEIFYEGGVGSVDIN